MKAAKYGIVGVALLLASTIAHAEDIETADSTAVQQETPETEQLEVQEAEQQDAQEVATPSKTLHTEQALQLFLSGAWKPVTLSEHERDSIFYAAMAQAGKNKQAKAETQEPRYRLEYKNKIPLYRHSFMADYYLIDTQKNTRTMIGGGPVRDAKLSPNGKYVVYAKNNNLYIYKVDFNTEVEITNHNGQRNYTDVDARQHTELRMFNGVSDWLYEEEFGVTRLFEFSPDSRMVAFVRLDDQQVPRFEWQEYINDTTWTPYPALRSLRYSKAGENIPNVMVYVYDIHYKTTKPVPATDNGNCYVPRIRWSNPIMRGKELEDAKLIVQRINRDQNLMEVLAVNPRSTALMPIYKEHSDKYHIDYSLMDSWLWLKDNRFIVLSEQSGWRSLYLCNQQGGLIRKLTPDGVDVTAVYGVDEETGWLYYQATETPLTRQCYAVNLKRDRIIDLTYEDGIHQLYFSPDKHWAIEHYESIDDPGQYTLHEVKGDKLVPKSVFEDNELLKAEWDSLHWPQKEFFTFTTERGDELQGWRLLPNNYEEGKKYPCVMMQYSGPASQQVKNRWRKGFGHVLAASGYVVINVDPRGTDGKGRAWRNETYLQLGQKEAEDQLSAARYAAALPYVDKDRIGIIGWSYGGYAAIRTLCQQESTAPLLRCGVAIAPVTDWQLYDAAYTERYMRRPQVNPQGYEAASLIPMAHRLTGKLLLVHGLADDNVHAQNTFRLTDALVQAGKQFEMQIYPDDNHFLRKRGNYEHLHRRILLFLRNNL